MLYRRFLVPLLSFAHAICLGAQSSPAASPPDCLFSSFYKSTLSWESGLAWGSGPSMAAGRGDLVGRVIGVRDGEGLAGARVRLSPTGGMVITDSTGRFAILGLRQGRYLVTVIPPPTSGALSVSDSVTVGFDGLRVVAALSAHRGDLVCVSIPRQPPSGSTVAAVHRTEDPPLAIADSIRALFLAAARAVVDSELATVRDTAPACVSFVRDGTHYRAEPSELRRLADGRRRYIPRTECPRTYTSMIARVDSLGSAIDPAPKGYVDPHYLQLLLPGRWTNDRLDIEVDVGQGTSTYKYLCFTRLRAAGPVAACRLDRVSVS